MIDKITQIKSKIPNYLIYIGVIGLCFIYIFAKLSLWQFTRSLEKAQMLAKINHINEKNTKNYLTNIKQVNIVPEYNYVNLYGYWDYSHLIYLSNKFYQHKPGYHVITPFVLSNAQAVLINRGWVANVEESLIDKKNKPLHSSYTTITGVVKKYNPEQYIMGANLTSYNNYYIIQKLDLSTLKTLFKYNLSEKYLNLIQPKNNGFILDWQWTNISPNKHLAYATQWLLLAITTILLYIYLCYNTLITNGKQ